MASYEAVCVACGKSFRRTSSTDTVAVMQESPAVHAPGSEGDDHCAEKYAEMQKAVAEEQHKADLAAAQALLDAEKPSRK